MKRNELFQERSSAMKKFSVVLILSLCVFFASCQSEEAPQTEKTAVPGGRIACLGDSSGRILHIGGKRGDGKRNYRDRHGIRNVRSNGNAGKRADYRGYGRHGGFDSQ